MRAIIKKSQSTATRCSIINNLSNHRTRIVKEEFISNSNLASRFYQHIPKTHFLIQFTKKENFYLSICLFFCSIKTNRRNLSIIEDKSITFIKIIYHITEFQKLSLNRIAISILFEHFNFSRLLMQYHQTCLITTSNTECLLCAIRPFNGMLYTMWIQCHLI